MKGVELSKKKSLIFASAGLTFWAVVAWLFLTGPIFIIDALPEILPLSVFAFLLFLIGLLCLTTAGTTILRTVAPRYVFLVIVSAASLLVAYNSSPLAPGWSCYGKRLYVKYVKAASNCITVCTSNDKKPCSGWSSCWDKYVSCSSAGIDQGGRPCQGCCFSCDVVCEEDPDPTPTYSPPTITASLACPSPGNNGWCKASETITMAASDPQGFALTISGDIGGTSFSCAVGNSCTKSLPAGSGTINYDVSAATSGLTDSGSTTWKLDPTHPTATISMPSTTGSNGWFTNMPVVISVTGSDTYSGLAVARLSTDNTTWQPSSVSLSTEGKYEVWYGADDRAGNRTDYPGQFVNIDTTPPELTPSISGTMGTNGWYVSNVIIDASASDNLSGVSSVVISDNGDMAKPVPITLTDGAHELTITATDVAGNRRSTTLDLSIDTSEPIITPSITGIAGHNSWYVSDVDVMATVSDSGSGPSERLDASVDGGAWITMLPVHFTEGEHALDLRAYDEAGNETTKTLTIYVDTTPPVLSTSTTGASGNSGWYISEATTNITATDSGSGIDSIEYKLNDREWANGVSVLSHDGINTIVARAYDIAGNSTTKTLDIKVDTVAPGITPVVPTPAGLDDWFVSGPVVISATGSDATSGLLSALVSEDEKNWEESISLPDGMHSATFRSEDVAGNRTSIHLDLKIDAAKPTLEISTSGTLGASGWYTSPVTTTFETHDSTSGVDRVEYSQDGQAWRTGISAFSNDGVSTVLVKAYDRAGNFLDGQTQVKVDTGMPASFFTLPANGSTDTVARNIFPLSGTASDTLSGIGSVEISHDVGKTWALTHLSKNGTWTYDFDTTKVTDGIYTFIARTRDLAGNTVVSTANAGAHATVIVNNIPPHITLTPDWFIWNSGELLIKSESFPLKNGTLVISDPQHRWPALKIPFDEKYPSKISWDRRFANGVLAPIGNYDVHVSACNIYDLCSSKTAVIKIPWVSILLPTAAPSTPTVPANTEDTSRRTENEIPPAVGIYSPQLETPKAVEHHPENTPLFLIVFLALLWAVSSAALADRRPVAINAITKTIHQKQNIKP